MARGAFVADKGSRGGQPGGQPHLPWRMREGQRGGDLEDEGGAEGDDLEDEGGAEEGNLEDEGGGEMEV